MAINSSHDDINGQRQNVSNDVSFPSACHSDGARNRTHARHGKVHTVHHGTHDASSTHTNRKRQHERAAICGTSTRGAASHSHCNRWASDRRDTCHMTPKQSSCRQTGCGIPRHMRRQHLFSTTICARERVRNRHIDVVHAVDRPGGSACSTVHDRFASFLFFALSLLASLLAVALLALEVPHLHKRSTTTGRNCAQAGIAGGRVGKDERSGAGLAFRRRCPRRSGSEATLWAESRHDERQTGGDTCGMDQSVHRQLQIAPGRARRPQADGAAYARRPSPMPPVQDGPQSSIITPPRDHESDESHLRNDLRHLRRDPTLSGPNYRFRRACDRVVTLCCQGSCLSHAVHSASIIDQD